MDGLAAVCDAGDPPAAAIVVDSNARTPATARVLDGAAPPSHGVSGIVTSVAGLGSYYTAQVLQVGGFAIGALKDGEG